MVANKERDEVFQRCIDIYGSKSQQDVMIEEMSELTKAILKLRRALRSKESTIGLRDKIIDEIADVEIMCRQMELVYNAETEVEEMVNRKVNRQKERLNEYELRLIKNVQTYMDA